MKKATAEGFLTATDMAEYLVKKGMPFREAHRVTGSVVKYCVENGLTLGEASLDTLKQFSKLIGRDIFQCLTVETSVNEKKSYGGTSGKLVRSRIQQIKRKK